MDAEECKGILCRVLGEFTECTVVIDGLDEYEHLDLFRNEGIDILNDLHQALSGADTTRCCSKKFLIASRENCLDFYENSNSTFTDTTRLTKLEFVALKGDIESMVRSYLLDDGFNFKKTLNNSPETLTEVTEKVCARSENLLVKPPPSKHLPFVYIDGSQFSGCKDPIERTGSGKDHPRSQKDC